MKGQRIIFAVTNDLTYDRRMFRICSTLAEAGADVTLVGRRFRNSDVFSPGMFRWKRLRCFFNKGFLFYKEFNIRLFFYLLFSKFDIACACDLDTALPVRLAAGMKAKLSVYDAHEFFTEVPELTGRNFIRKVWDFIGVLTIPGFDLRYTVGEELATLMNSRYKAYFHVIRNIPSYVQRRDDEEVVIKRDEKILLYQGALNVGRGLEACLEAMVQLPDWEFWLAGEGDITSKLKDQANKLKINDRVNFLGWVYSHDLPELMTQARLGINLREEGSVNDYYSLPNKFFDFIHAGLPSINMNYPEYARIVDRFPCALLIDKISPQLIAESIQHLDSNTVLYNAMVTACQDAAMEFTWTHEGNKLITLYNDLVIKEEI